MKSSGQAEVPAFDECAGLGRALQHERAARAYAQREALGLARAVDDFQGVVQQAVVHAHLLDFPLHGQDVGGFDDRSRWPLPSREPVRRCRISFSLSREG